MYARQKMPDECVIEWWYMIADGDYDPGNRRQITKLDLRHIPKDRAGELQLIFAAEGVWTAELVP